MLHLGEELLLLSLAHDCGRLPGSGSPVHATLAAAILAELELLGHLQLREGRLTVLADHPADPTLAEVHSHLRRNRTIDAAQDWIQRLPGQMDLAHQIAIQLTRQGRLRVERRTLLGLFSMENYSVATPSPDKEVRLRLRGMLSHHTRHDPRSRALVALANASGLLRLQFDAADWAAAQANAEALTASVPMAGLLRRVLDSEADDAALLLMLTASD